MVAHITSAEAPRWIADRLAGLAGTRWVGVDGWGASGKTTLAERLAHLLPGTTVIHIDDFARPGVRGWERMRFVRQVVRPLLAGRSARYQRWDWPSDSGAEWHQVAPGHVLICEGVSSTDSRLPVPWDLTCWVEAPYAVRIARAIERDGEAMLDTWLTDWIPSEEAYVRVQRPQERVDAIVTASIHADSAQLPGGPQRP